MTRIYWNESVVVLLLGAGTVRLYQPHYRRNILVDFSLLSFLDKLVQAGAGGVAVDELPKQGVQVRDVTTFTLFDNALANPSMYDEATVRLGLEDEVDLASALDILEVAGIVSKSWPITYDHSKQGFADQFKGNFYEQVGTECLLNRVQPPDWWTNQKFERNLEATRETAYQYIEERFLDTYLAETMQGLSVADIGCGTGYYTHKMAQYASEVVGLDYNVDYIKSARELWGAGKGKAPYFSVCDIIDFEAEDPNVIERRYDRVVLVDTFLFLFDSIYQPMLHANRSKVMRNMRRLLKEDGRMIIMDPNPLWLTPWFGSKEHPFGILESYNTRNFKVVPSLEEVTSLLDENDLAIRRILEPKPTDDMLKVKPRDYNFYKEVPPWWVYELQMV